MYIYNMEVSVLSWKYPQIIQSSWITSKYLWWVTTEDPKWKTVPLSFASLQGNRNLARFDGNWSTVHMTWQPWISHHRTVLVGFGLLVHLFGRKKNEILLGLELSHLFHQPKNIGFQWDVVKTEFVWTYSEPLTKMQHNHMQLSCTGIVVIKLNLFDLFTVYCNRRFCCPVLSMNSSWKSWNLETFFNDIPRKIPWCPDWWLRLVEPTHLKKMSHLGFSPLKNWPIWIFQTTKQSLMERSRPSIHVIDLRRDVRIG